MMERLILFLRNFIAGTLRVSESWDRVLFQQVRAFYCNCSISGGAELGLSKERGRFARISRRSSRGAAKMAALPGPDFWSSYLLFVAIFNILNPHFSDDGTWQYLILASGVPTLIIDNIKKLNIFSRGQGSGTGQNGN